MLLIGEHNSTRLMPQNIGNLNVHFAIPVFSKIGRGGFNFARRELAYLSA
jgi:hypothetical protein